MNTDSSRKSLIFILSIAALIVAFTIILVILARGYRLDIENNGIQLKATGLLSATSRPKSASVYVDNILKSATDDTLNLPPGEYNLRISKAGYLPWSKTIQIFPEVVYQSDAQLFLASPEAKLLTLLNTPKSSLSPDNQKIIYSQASESATSKDSGLYLLELTDIPLLPSLSSQKLLLNNTPTIDWNKYNFEFSPNSRQVLATAKSLPSYLLNLDQNLSTQKLTDITIQIPQIYLSWAELKSNNLTQKLINLPPSLKEFVATDSAILSFNGNEHKLLYEASQSGTLKQILANPPPSRSTQPETRQLQENQYYVYDFKEDTNFFIGDSTFNRLQWIPGTDYLIYLKGNQLFSIESDNTNVNLLFNFLNTPQQISLTPDGTRVIVHGQELNQESTRSALYTLTIRER